MSGGHCGMHGNETFDRLFGSGRANRVGRRLRRLLLVVLNLRLNLRLLRLQ